MQVNQKHLNIYTLRFETIITGNRVFLMEIRDYSYLINQSNNDFAF